MENLIKDQGWVFLGMGISFLGSILCQLSVAYYIIRMVRESEKLEEEKAKLLKEWIEEYIKEEENVHNIPVFIDKKMQQFCIGQWPLMKVKHASGQALLLMIFLAGVGACFGIIQGKTLGQILPFYLVSLFGIYVHFSLSGFINIEENKKTVCMNLVDYLENKKPYLYTRTIVKEEKDIEEVKKIFGEEQDLELKEIIREILA